MVVDAAMELYYEAHPLVERAKASLTGTMVTSSRKRKSLPDTAFIPLDINPDPDLPLEVTETERLLNQLSKPNASGGRLTQEEHARLPDELPPDWNVDPGPEPDTTPSDFWKEQMRRMMRKGR